MSKGTTEKPMTMFDALHAFLGPMHAHYGRLIDEWAHDAPVTIIFGSGGDTVHTAQAVVPPSGSERKLGRWDFEGGGYVEIRATPGVSTEDALDMAQTLIDLRRKELARMKRDVAPTGSESGE